MAETKLAKPFLRWAGGKRWLKKDIDELVNINNYENYHEPFVGGGAILFHLKPTNAFISDANKELIDTYLAIRENPNNVIENLKKFKKDKESYYIIRSQNFENNFQKAAQFIYLNQMSFNGIYRVNANGGYNVPYGNREKYDFDYVNILLVSEFLQNITIQHCDFQESLNNVGENDLVFLDPPYTIAHNLNGFVQYNQKIFSLDDQYRLTDAIDQIKEIGANYILTNAAHSKVREIFDKENDTILEISRASVVGGKNSIRGQYSEYLFTNL
ncbi:Dam family site-specific DNA-(adenine-N6)-methyltransferase [Flavobacterium rhamnosiphilum]|uniref:Site-specific DNA-methyltransferase (adenine-specific) n=1 Tax=Flavobacterium rhamnosiphilum TaxID=2541724 RepID=A0A4R5F435_9FLAO|nr:Dam family site-specific DNA-(adenine-N6)-methyltransferase [Flavobacterium rhamnosiphilum]TDE42223.1 Dam family site-specific DNA-(adenine-N6)-methyltransferase [Flavobacterium rhamnosiphilum]